MKPLVLLALMLASETLPAIEPADSHRLDLRVERIDEDIVVDGVAMRIQTARGSGVPELARRMEGRWRAEGGELQRLEHSGWHMLARWLDGRSELIQWRGSGSVAELLHSRLDTTRPVSKRGAPPFMLPSTCQWGRAVEGVVAGRRYATLSAWCRMDLTPMQGLLIRSLQAQGWMIRHQSRTALQVEGDGLQGELLLAQAAAGATSIVWVGSRP